MQTYSTRDGDMVDAIIWRHYGAQNAAMLRVVLEANPGLSAHGARLPAGVSVVLPDIEQPTAVEQGFALWD